MPTSPEGFDRRIARLKADLTEQGRRAQALLERAVDAVFARDAALAEQVERDDDPIDRADIQIERACVAILSDATGEGAALSEAQLRMILTIVKVNNELERIADSGVAIAQHTSTFSRLKAAPPAAFRVMANSVIASLQSANDCFDRQDEALARIVLRSDDAVLEFERRLMRESEERISRGEESVDIGYVLHSMASELDRVEDHCTNIAEQVIYTVTGSIVRHSGDRWTMPRPAQ